MTDDDRTAATRSRLKEMYRNIRAGNDDRDYLQAMNDIDHLLTRGDRLAETVQRVEALADWHETKAEKARRFRVEINGRNEVMDKAARVHDDAARRIRAALNPTPTEEDRDDSIGPMTRAAMEWVACGSHPPGCCDGTESPDGGAHR